MWTFFICWFSIGLISLIVGMWHDINYDDQEFELEEVPKYVLLGTLLGIVTTYFLLQQILKTLGKKGYKLKKKKKQNIDPMLFDGKEKVYDSIHERVQQNLKEFKK